MPPLNSATRVFNVIELRDYICSFLTRRELLRLVLISRLWNEIFTPSLWCIFDYKKSDHETIADLTTTPATLALEKHLCSIKAFRTHSLSGVHNLLRAIVLSRKTAEHTVGDNQHAVSDPGVVSDQEMSEPVMQLQRLAIVLVNVFVAEKDRKAISELLRLNYGAVQDLELDPFFNFSSDKANSSWTESMPRLRTLNLTITPLNSLTAVDMQRFLQDCPAQLEELSVIMTGEFADGPSLNCAFSSQSQGRGIRGRKLKKFTLQNQSTEDESVMWSWFLKECPRVSCMTFWGELSSRLLMDSIADGIVDRGQGLTELGLKSLHEALDDEALSMYITRMGHSPLGSSTLGTLSLDVVGTVGVRTKDALKAAMATLEQLSLTSLQAIKGSDVQSLLCVPAPRLKKLSTLVGYSIGPYDAVLVSPKEIVKSIRASSFLPLPARSFGHPGRQSSLPTTPLSFQRGWWGFENTIQSLELSVLATDILPKDDVHLVMRQFGRLTLLQTLTLKLFKNAASATMIYTRAVKNGPGFTDWSLGRGGLDELQGLCLLKELELEGFKVMVGQAEVDWIGMHWPKLVRFTGCGSAEAVRGKSWNRSFGMDRRGPWM